MAGFEHIITFNSNGKITNFQRSYTNEHEKILKIYLPLNFNNKKNYYCKFSVAINNTYPTQIEELEGNKVETDLNCYIFNLTNIFKLKLGLGRIELFKDNGRSHFKSEAFRL